MKRRGRPLEPDKFTVMSRIASMVYARKKAGRSLNQARANVAGDLGISEDKVRAAWRLFKERPIATATVALAHELQRIERPAKHQAEMASLRARLNAVKKSHGR